MNKYILSRYTQYDIEEIYRFTKKEFGKEQAIQYLEGLRDSFDLLANNPNIGRSRDEFKKGLLSLPFQSHIIFYRIFKNHIRIVRVLYGGRDLIKFLK